jgi:biotin-dependent carboxylase-like uncharacterized protein
VGFQRAGIPESGPLDAVAAVEGAALLGNPAGAAHLEMVGFGLRLVAQDGAIAVALTGAEMEAAIDGVAMAPRTTAVVPPGGVLEVGAPTRGFVGQLHVGGGVGVPSRWGSTATDVRGGYGGYEGRPLRPGDVLLAAGSACPSGRTVPDLADRWRTALRVVWSPQAELFDAATRERFLGSSFVVDARRDRLATVLAHDDARFEAVAGRRTLSHPTVFGDVQVSGAGEPMVLLADRQTTGGYPRIVTVITADHAALVQRPTGSPVTLVLVERDEAVAALLDQRARLARVVRQLPPVPVRPGTDLHTANLISGVTDAGTDDAGDGAS